MPDTHLVLNLTNYIDSERLSSLPRVRKIARKIADVEFDPV